MNLTCYRIHDDAPELIPARSLRAWTDATAPHAMANSTGWALICPFGVSATWNGGAEPSDLVIEQELGGQPPLFAQSLYGRGVLTFHLGHLFRTDPEWAIWCRGAPSAPKDGIVALEELVETDWPPVTFTMNWLFTHPGAVRFEKGEPCCFLLPLSSGKSCRCRKIPNWPPRMPLG